MTTKTVQAKFIAASLCALLVACSVTRYTAPVGTEELADLVLIIRELPDGRLTHSWQPAEGFDLSGYRLHARSDGPQGRDWCALRPGLAIAIRNCRTATRTACAAPYLRVMGTSKLHAKAVESRSIAGKDAGNPIKIVWNFRSSVPMNSRL